MQHVSLAALLQNTRNYNQMPIFLQQMLKRSVWITLITESALLLFFVVVPHESFIFRVSEGGFFLIGTDVINSILEFGYRALPYLALINLVNMFVTLLVISLSLGMLLPVRIRFHYLAAANAIPTGASMVSMAFVVFLLVLAFAINLIIWFFIISIVLGIIGALLSGG